MSNLRAAITFSNAGKLGPYERALREAGIEPVRNPLSLGSLDGLLLTGGTDVDPLRYGQQRISKTDRPDTARDEMEAHLLAQALEDGLPVLGICRGLQIFNVVYGGTLIQHLEGVDLHRQQPADAVPGRHPAAHRVCIKEGSRLAAIVGAGEHEVNSRHHQAAGRPGRQLLVSAVSPDGVIEALEDPHLPFALAVQWHPEDRIDVSPADCALFTAFAAAMRNYALDPEARKSRSDADQPGHPRLSA